MNGIQRMSLMQKSQSKTEDHSILLRDKIAFFREREKSYGEKTNKQTNPTQ